MSITGALRIPRENYNERRVIDFFIKRALCVGNAQFKHKKLRKYTRVSSRQQGVDTKSMIDLVLIKKDILYNMPDVRAVIICGSR